MQIGLSFPYFCFFFFLSTAQLSNISTLDANDNRKHRFDKEKKRQTNKQTNPTAS
jgi:hypothetical protein